MGVELAFRYDGLLLLAHHPHGLSSAMFFWDEYPRYQTSLHDSPAMTHPEVMTCVRELEQIRPDAIQIRQIGESVEGRAILSVTLGTGSRRVLAWSQMHGDEPTHTAVLLDLINFLQRAPEHGAARAITQGCTLSLIPMLNPDGAARGTRRNAQDLDVNRDARHLQSPEGRILRQAVQTIAPHFAFNLHNQRSRTTVGRTHQPAAVSLLVPAIDPQESDTQQVALSRKVASCFLRAVQPHCPGMISRYDAEFMPRAFGEWVQQQGAATVLVEAGGWPSAARSPLRQLHFHGLLSTLCDLATDAHLKTDDVAYQALLRSGEHDLFDCLIREVTVDNPNQQKSFVTDLGINFPHDGKPNQEREREATIEDLGDLQITTGRTVIEGQNLTCLPGRAVTSPECSPLRPPSDTLVQQLLASGVTSLVGHVDLTDPDEVNSLDHLPQHPALPVNIGYLASAPSLPDAWPAALRDRLLFGMARGLLGLVAGQVPADIQRYLDWYGLPLVRDPQDVSGCLRHLRRGAIRLNRVADLVLVNASENDDSDLQQVIVGGNVAFDRGRVVHDSCGAMLTIDRRAAVNRHWKARP